MNPPGRRRRFSEALPRGSGLLRLPSAILVLASVVAFTAAGPVAAQAPDRDVEAELGASVFFGNTSQTTINTRLAASRADSMYELSSQGTFSYGEAEDDQGESFVVSRAWDLEASLDWHPYARVSPFVFGQGESSFQRRIDFRYNLGAGGKFTFVQSERSRLDLSLALLAEQTFLRDDAPPSGDADESLLARWAARFRARKELSDGRVTLSTENFYRPVFDDFNDYVVESRSALSFALSEIVSLKLSFVDTYDSRAVARGADANNEGQLLFSVLGSL